MAAEDVSQDPKDSQKAYYMLQGSSPKVEIPEDGSPRPTQPHQALILIAFYPIAVKGTRQTPGFTTHTSQATWKENRKRILDTPVSPCEVSDIYSGLQIGAIPKNQVSGDRFPRIKQRASTAWQGCTPK